MLFRSHELLFLFGSMALHAGAQTTTPTVGGCPVFPPTSDNPAINIWNQQIDTLSKDQSHTNAWVPSIGAAATLHQDFGGAAYHGALPGFRINLVTGNQPKVPIMINEGLAESDPGPYPFPPEAKVEDGIDAHVLVVDTTNCVLYETYSSVKNRDNSWTVYSAAFFDLRKNLLRPPVWTSADAAGLPILPGLARYEEIEAGAINHALRFTAPRTAGSPIWPARHSAGAGDPNLVPPMGARFRLSEAFQFEDNEVTVKFSQPTKIILRALKKYGMMLADNGGAWYIQGTYDTRWPNLADEWRRIPGSAFEAVDVSSFMGNPDSAAVHDNSLPPPELKAVGLTPFSVTGGQTATLRVLLTTPAPAGGLPVTVWSDSSAVPVTNNQIAAGEWVLDVPVTTTAVTTKTVATIGVTVKTTTMTATLTVNPASRKTRKLSP